MQTAATAINPLVTFPERAVKPTHRDRCRNMPSEHLCDIVIENSTEQFNQVQPRSLMRQLLNTGTNGLMATPAAFVKSLWEALIATGTSSFMKSLMD